MPAGDWNYLAARVTGNGEIDVIETELPLTVGAINRNLSAPSTMPSKITNAVKRLKHNGRPVFDPGSTVIIAEASGVIRGMGLYQDEPRFNGADWDLDIRGLAGYPLGIPYNGEMSWTGVDPLNVYRHIWDHVQGQRNGNLGITLDRDVYSPVRLGTPIQEGVTGSGPYLLNWWTTSDLGKVIDDLTQSTPFDWAERVGWGDQMPACHIELGYPILGAPKERHSFVLGVNLAAMPGVRQRTRLTEAWVLGAGEGRTRVRGVDSRNDEPRLRQVRVIDDKSKGDEYLATVRARQEMASAVGDFTVAEIEVYDHPNAPLSEIELGDQTLLYAETPHVDVDFVVRVVGISEDPKRSDRATLTVVRMDQNL